MYENLIINGKYETMYIYKTKGKYGNAKIIVKGS
jgi:hypothetical protein